MPPTYSFPHTWDAERYPSDFLRLGSPHEAIVARCLSWLTARGHFVTEVDVGAKRLRGRAAMVLRAAGVRSPGKLLTGHTGAGMAGVVDIVGVAKNGRAIFVEVKSPQWLVPSKVTGRLVQKRPPDEATPEQLAFLHSVHVRGGYACVAWWERDLEQVFGAGVPPRAHPANAWMGMAT